MDLFQSPGIVTTDGLRGSIPLLVPKLKVLITNLTSDYMSYKLSTIREAFNKSYGVRLGLFPGVVTFTNN